MSRHRRHRTVLETLEPRTLLSVAPTDISLSSTTIAENKPLNSIVGKLTAVDADPLDRFTYALIAGAGGDDNALFAIAGPNLKIKSAANFELESSYSIRINVTDKFGDSFEKQFAINITDVNEAPTATPLNFTIAPNSEQNFTSAVFSFVFADPDSDPSPTLDKIKINSVPKGSLLLNGVKVKPNQEIPVADLDFLTYVPRVNTTGLDTFKWSPSDGMLYSKTPAVTTIFTMRPLIYVTATKPKAAEFNNVAGQFTIKRQGGAIGMLPVEYIITGTASDDGSDYTLLSGVAFFPAGKTSVTVSIVPVDDFDIEGIETLTLNIKPFAAYFIAVNQKPATVTIADHNRKITLGTFAPLVAVQNSPLAISFDDLITAAGAADPESEPLTIKIKSIAKGTLTKNAAPVAANTTLTDGDDLEWTPPADTVGSLVAFTITISDGVNTSPPIQIMIDVGVAALNSINANITDTDGNGTFDSLTETDPAIYNLVVRYIPPVITERAVIEFNVSTLPAGAIIDSATFTMSERAYANDVGTVHIMAYAGNGVISLSDATVAATEVGTYNALALGLGDHVIALNTLILQNLRATNSWIGLRFEASDYGVNTAFASLNNASHVTSPSLDFTYHISSPFQATLNPVADGTANDADGNGTFDSVNTAGSSLSLREFPGIVRDRAMMEFNFASIPAGKTFDSVEFTFAIASYTSSTKPVNLVAYAADGSITLADASAAATIVGTYDAANLGLGDHTISLAAQTLQTLFASNQIIGLRLEPTGSANTQIGSSESGFTPPTLIIHYH